MAENHHEKMDLLKVRSVSNTLVKKYPTYRDTFVNGSWKWIEGKRKDDNAEGLWRIHDKLYDLNSFIDRHPGGKFWIEATEGTDITEAFESHHISSQPYELLETFFVRDAEEKRNYFYTFDENGFYRTLKSRVAAKLNSIGMSAVKKSERVHDMTLIAFLIMIVVVNRVQSNDIYWLSVAFAGQLLTWLVVMSHNFLHKADNWRMYTANLALMTTRDLRIQHILSHHMYPNTYADIEVTCYEPYYKWLPIHAKGWYYRVMTVILSISAHTIYFHNTMRFRMQGFFWGNDRTIFWDELVMLVVPSVMIIFGGHSLSFEYLHDVFFRWVHIMLAANFLYVIHYMSRGNHAPHLVHQGDEIKSFDFGDYQISTVADRKGANWNIFTSLAYDGEQILHQLFPSLDHAILPQLKPILLETCEEFGVKLNECTMLESVINQWRQLYRTEVNYLDSETDKKRK